jgi:parvulin-like peptidyl-prolyl isomerase
VDTRVSRPKRSVRHAEEVANRPKPTASRRHQSRAERERRLRLAVYVGAAFVILLILLIPGYGYYREVLRLGDQPMLAVDGQTFSVQDYARYVGTWQQILTKQIAAASSAAQAATANATAAPTAAVSAAPTVVPGASPNPAASPVASPTVTPTAQQTAAQVTLQTLQSEQASLPSSGLSNLAEAKLLTTEAKNRGMTASQTELDDALRWLLSPPAGNLQPSNGITAAPVTLPVTGTLTLDQAKTQLATLTGNGRYLSEAEITDLILKPAVFKEKLVVALAPNVSSTEDEVHARHILVADLATAQDVKKQLDAGGDFAALAAKYSTDTGSKDKGGDLGWFGKGVMVPEFETAAFSLKPGQISDPVKSQFGYHIIQVLANDPNHPIDPARVAQLREQPYQDWLSKAESDQTRVTYSTTTAKTTWVQNFLGQTG